MSHPNLQNSVVELPSNTPTEVVDDFLIVPEDDPTRPAYYTAGDLYTSLVTSQETDFDFNVFDFYVPPGGGPPPHTHFTEDETWQITDGEVQFIIGDQANLSRLVLPEKTVVFGPRERAHGFLNIDSTAAISGVTPGARALSMTNPGSLDLFFEAISRPATDRDDPIPRFPVNIEDVLKYALRTGTGLLPIGLGLDPNYQPPEDANGYVIVLPEDAEEEVVEAALALDAELDELSVWTTGDHAGLPQRPTYTGSFGIEYTSLMSLEESRDEFSYNQFSLEPQDADNFPDPVESDDHVFFYVNEGQLSVEIGDEVRVVGENSFLYIAPGNEYSIANFGDETVESLAVTVVDQELQLPQGNELFPSPLNSQGGLSPDELVFLSDEADFFDHRSVGEHEHRHRIYGGKGNDEILANVEDRAFGEDGDDLLDASLGSGRNLLDGGYGNDILLAGSNDQLVGADGEDHLNIRRGGNNLLYGGSGADQFRIVNGKLPDAVEVQYPENRNLILSDTGVSLPELVDTRNTIMDFELGVDKLHILGMEDFVSSFDDLQLLPAIGDLRSTSIIATFTEDGIEKEISLANLSGVIFNELSANDFVFA